MKKLILIGPVAPYRGGISHFTTLLAQNLKKKIKLKIISFKRLYPNFLYPGKFQIVKKISRNKKFLIDTLNPISWYSVYKNILQFKPDAVMIIVWTPYLFIFNLFLIYFLKKKNIHISINFLNFQNHKNFFLDKFINNFYLNNANTFFFDEKIKKSNLKFKKNFVINLVKPQHTIKRKSIKKKLKKKPCLEILFCGFIRPYKGLDILLKAASLLRDKEFFLRIVGEPWGAKGKLFWNKLIDNLGLTNCVEFRPKYLETNKLIQYINRADVLILPYLSVTGSGLIPLAFYLNKPVIVSDVGNFPNLVNEFRTGLVFKKGNYKDLSKKIIYFSKNKNKITLNNFKKFNDKYNFKNYTKRLIFFLKKNI